MMILDTFRYIFGVALGIAIGVTAALIIGGLLASCSAPRDSAPGAATGNGEAITVQIATVEIGDIGSRTVYVANVAPMHQADVAPVGSGLIEKLHVDIGDVLQKGQVIAELTHGTLDAQLRQAEARLLNSRASLGSVRAELEPNRIMAQARVDAAEARLEQLIDPSQLDLQAAASSREQAEAELESARTQFLQLQDPTESQLASARALVGQAQSRLSQAQLATNAEIANQTASRTQTLWNSLLRSRIDLQASQSLLQNLRQDYDLDLKESDIAAAEQIVEQNRRSISGLLSRIESDSTIPRNVSDALWAESSAQSALKDAQARLHELENPNRNSVALAQSRIDAAQASLDAANAELSLLRSPTAAAVASAAAELADAEQGLVLAQEQQVRHKIEAAQATVDQAQAEVQLVQKQLDDLRVLAPFDGLVSKRWLSPGAAVTPQSPIITLSSRQLVVSLQVEEVRIKSLRIGDPVTFSSPALPGSNLEMKIDRVSPSGDFQEHTFLVQLRPPDDVPDLKPGMSGEVSIGDLPREAVLVPGEALIYRDNQPAVFTVENNQARLLNVEVGLADAASVEILAGVIPGDRVVVSGQDLLADGVRVVAVDP